MKIRLPEALKAQIEHEAQKAGRTLNAEVLARLENSFQTAEKARSRELDAEIAAMEQRADLLSLQLHVVRGRIDGHVLRQDQVLAEIERLITEPPSPANLARAVAFQESLDSLRQESGALKRELLAIADTRDRTLRRVGDLKAYFHKTGGALDEMVREAQSRR